LSKRFIVTILHLIIDISAYWCVELQVKGSQVPWTLLQQTPEKLIQHGIPPTGLLREPSRMTRHDAVSIYDFWYGLQEKEETPLTFHRAEKSANKAKRRTAKPYMSTSEGDGEDGLQEGEYGEEEGREIVTRSRSVKKKVGEEVGTEEEEREVGLAMEVDSDGDDFAKGGTGGKGGRAGEKGKAKEAAPAHPESPAAATDKLAYLFNLSTNGDYLKALTLIDYAVSVASFDTKNFPNFAPG
jgi:hypothetical protein